MDNGAMEQLDLGTVSSAKVTWKQRQERSQQVQVQGYPDLYSEAIKSYVAWLSKKKKKNYQGKK